MLDKLLPFLIAGALGLAIGIERERRHQDIRSMGARTFILLGILGALTGIIENALLQASICFFTGSAIVAGYIRASADIAHHKKVDIGLTTEIAGGATFVLGYLAHVDALLSAILGLLVLIILLSRQTLHRFSKEQLRPNEIQAAVILFVLLLGVLPLVPENLTGPWGLFNVKQIVIIVSAIAGVQFLSYVGVRIFGDKVGMPLAGFLGGFVSSTAVFLSLPALVKKDKALAYSVASAGMFASVSTFLFLFFVVAVLSVGVFLSILPILLPSMVMGSAVGLFLAKYQAKESVFPVLKNPLSIRSAIRLGLLLAAIMAALALIQKFLGVPGLKVASFLSGFGELHAVSISTTSLYNASKISEEIARNCILLAALASMLSKLIITWILSRERYAWVVTAGMLLMIVAFLLPWWIF